MCKIANELKIPFIQMENIFFSIYDKLSKIEEVEYLTHDIKFKTWRVLFYKNSLFSQYF